jgi:hypothetical protein
VLIGIPECHPIRWNFPGCFVANIVQRWCIAHDTAKVFIAIQKPGRNIDHHRVLVVLCDTDKWVAGVHGYCICLRIVSPNWHVDLIRYINGCSCSSWKRTTLTSRYWF